MTKDELLKLFEENGIVFQIIMDHGDGVHVSILNMMRKRKSHKPQATSSYFFF
jgi:hypothetical protein